MTPYTHINTNIWIWIDCCVGRGCEVNIATRVYKMPPSLCSLCFTVKVYENKSQIPTKECHLIILDKKENKHIFCLISNCNSFEIKFLGNLLQQMFLRLIVKV